VGCRRFLEESRGDRASVYARAVTTSYTTLKDATPICESEFACLDIEVCGACRTDRDHLRVYRDSG
jgi:hypothetical protein